MPDIDTKIIHLNIQGMHCVMCARSIELSLRKTKGVKKIKVNYATSTAVIEAEKDIDESEIIKKIKKLGYMAEKNKKKNILDKRMYIVRFSSGFLLSIIIMILMHTGTVNIYSGIAGYLIGILSITFTIFISFPIFSAAYYNLKIPNLSMDVMYALGILTSTLATILSYLKVLPTEFTIPDTALMLGSFLMFGRFLEEMSKAKANLSIEKLIMLKPRKANRIIEKDEREEIEKIDISEVKTGDILLVKASEQIPSDGVVLSGSADIDTSVITGEETPEFVTAGKNVIGGTYNLNGLLKISITSTGDDTVLSKIINSALESSTKKTNIERFADKVIGYFLPTVLILATLSAIFWYFYSERDLLLSLSVFISTIVVACPCALGLATPAAVSAGIFKAAELGILIKDPAVFEKINKTDTVIFDKTGTLTRGEFSINSIYHHTEINREEFMKIAYSLARFSSHPLDRGITREAESKQYSYYSVENLQVIPGRGIIGIINDRKYLLGNERLVQENGIEIQNKPNKQGGVAYLANDKELLGYFIINDAFDNRALDLTEMLKEKGLEVIIISGDKEENVKRLAEHINTEKYFSDMTPELKAEKIREIKKSHRSVIFAGDGINDTNALLTADIGIAIGKGTDIAIEAGDVVLMKDDIRLINIFIEISRKVMFRIRFNLFLSTIYNIILIPFAMGISYKFWGILFKPEFSAMAMVISSISVVLISLNIYLYNPSHPKNSI